MNNQKANILSTHAKGDIGENFAMEYLLSKGYIVICRKYRSRQGEIDCIARDTDGTIVFIEVKSASSRAFGNPLFRVTPSKQKTIARIALQYIADHRLCGLPCRFDVIAVIDGKIDHLQNAFYAR